MNKKYLKLSKEIGLKNIGLIFESLKDESKRIKWTPEQLDKIKKFKEKSMMN